MPIDRRAQRLLDEYAGFGVPPLATLSPQEARKQPTLDDAIKVMLQKEGEPVTPEPVGSFEDMTLPGKEIPVRIYQPGSQGPYPVLVYFHGGGWVLGSPAFCDAACRALTNLAQCIVVSVDYRLAPEHPFPAAVDDAFDTLQWVLENAPSIGGDPQRVAVGGESAGGNLATVATLRARDEGKPLPIYQVLVYPVLNYAFDTPSYTENADARPLSRESMRWFWKHYLPNEEAGTHPYASPLRAESLAGLPPALVITAEYDPLRDEGEAYAQRLSEAGVPVVLSRYKDMTHQFFAMLPVVEDAHKAVLEVAAGLRSAFSREPQATQAQRPEGAKVADWGVLAETPSGMGSEAEAPGFQPVKEGELVPGVGEMAGTPHLAGSAQAVGHPEMFIGMAVVGSDGTPLGQVIAVYEHGVLVERHMQRDLIVPFEALSLQGGQGILSLPADQADAPGWGASSVM
ncbi:MAG TPA: alpha/beta hydrolase [Ktedonobacterales bacterium]|jgi:acetyl esterase